MRRGGASLNSDDVDLSQFESLQLQIIKRNEQRRLDTEQLRGRDLKNMLELKSARGNVDRHGDRTQPCASQEHLHELDPVSAHDGDAITAGDPRGMQYASATGRLIAGLRKGPRGSHAIKQGLD